MNELMALVGQAVEREMNSTIEAHVGADGEVQQTGAWAKLINALSQSPDKLFPMCSPVGVVARLHLLCPIVQISARIIIRNPPDFYVRQSVRDARGGHMHIRVCSDTNQQPNNINYVSNHARHTQTALDGRAPLPQPG